MADRPDATYRALFERSPLPMWVYDPATRRILTANPAAAALYGYTDAEFHALSLDALRAPEDVAHFETQIATARDAGPLAHAARHVARDGRAFDVVVTGHPVTFDGRPARLAIVEDVTTRRAAEAARRVSEARFRAVFDHAAVGIVVCDWEGRVLESNAAIQALLGYTAEELRGMPTSRMSPPEEGAITRLPVRELKEGRCERVLVEKRYRRKDGQELWCELMVTRVEDGTSSFMLGMIHDVTERRRMQDELTRRAFHDPLTGLPNRALFRDRVGHALARASSQPAPVAPPTPRSRARAGTPPGARSGRGRALAVLFFDLDGFKRVNDSLGHLEGDRLLETMAGRLLGCTRPGDTVARLGGDEFAVLLEDLGTPDDAAGAAERALVALTAPVELDGSTITVGASVGIATRQPGDAPAGPDDLLREADAAMYAAKGRGRGGWARFEPAMHQRAMDRLRMEADLREAIAQGDIDVCYQPVVDLHTGQPRGMEALARWTHAVRGAVSPATFVPVAEETGLIVPLGRHVLGAACRQAAEWVRDAAAVGAAPVSIAVNLSARQLDDAGLVDDVRAALTASGLPPALLTLEITETALSNDAALALARLEALKALGVRLAVDDFGTGYASLTYLQRFPIDVLKVDKSLVDHVGADGSGQDEALVRAVIALGEALRLAVVAEGIEAPEQRAALARLGCRLGQGYLYARPLAAEDASAWLAVHAEPAAPPLRLVGRRA